MAVIPPASALWSKTLTMVGSIHVAGWTPTPAHQGCTPGFWKQEHHFDQWPPPYTPDTPSGEAFGVPNIPSNPTMLESLNAGGGGLNALLRQAVAALLNAAHPDIAYAYGVSEVVLMFQEAYTGQEYEPTKDQFEAANEAECPLPIPSPKAPPSETLAPTAMPEVSTVEAATATPTPSPTPSPSLTLAPTGTETAPPTETPTETATETPTQTAPGESPSAEPETPTPPL